MKPSGIPSFSQFRWLEEPKENLAREVSVTVLRNCSWEDQRLEGRINMGSMQWQQRKPRASYLTVK